MRTRIVLALCAACLLLPAGVAHGAGVPDSVLALDVMNDQFPHTTYVVTGETSSWYGASVKIGTSGLWLSGFDDQHEVSLTVYADRRYGELSVEGYRLYPTFALALMRNWRTRESVGLYSQKDDIAAFTLSTAATADEQNGRYVYARTSGGITMTVQPSEEHTYTVRYSGAKTYVVNDDTLAKPLYVNGIPKATNWVDLTSRSVVKGHLAYRWDAYVEDRLVDSAWLSSDKARVKIESNKRAATLPDVGTITRIRDVRLARLGPHDPNDLVPKPSVMDWRPWDRSIPVAVRAPKGRYASKAIVANSDWMQRMPTEREIPRAPVARFANPVAYDLKALRRTRFVFSADRPGVWAELTVACPSGTKRIYSGPAPAPGRTLTVAWDGLGPDGKRLPSATYDWKLTLSKGGVSNWYRGKVSVSRIWFTMRGTVKNGATARHAAYMLPGSANFYVSAKTSAAADRLSLRLAGPNGYRLTAPGSPYALSSAAMMSRTVYVRGAGAIASKAVHTFALWGRANVTYNITVIQ